MTTSRFKPLGAFRFSAIAALLALGAACGPFHMGGPDQSAKVIFINESLDQADVYASGPDGLPVRVGTVFAGRTDTLTVPATVVGQGGNVNFSARLLARSRIPQSGPVSIRPGDRIQVRLPSDETMLVVLPASSP
jgi:hypothetical protein